MCIFEILMVMQESSEYCTCGMFTVLTVTFTVLVCFCVTLQLGTSDALFCSIIGHKPQSFSVFHWLLVVFITCSKSTSSATQAPERSGFNSLCLTPALGRTKTSFNQQILHLMSECTSCRLFYTFLAAYCLVYIRLWDCSALFFFSKGKWFQLFIAVSVVSFISNLLAYICMKAEGSCLLNSPLNQMPCEHFWQAVKQNKTNKETNK